MALIKEQIKELPPSLLLIYAQLLEQVNAPLPAVKDNQFLRREISGKSYWFRRVQFGKTRMELSLGKETEELRTQIEQEKSRIKDAIEEAKSREHLVSMLIAGGAGNIDPLSGRVLALLEGAGVFVAGGVLVGSRAFNVYGNMLGYKFPLEAAQTADIDLSISVGVTKETTDLRTAIMESGMGFFEIPALERKSPSTSYKIRNTELKVELLTPLIGADSSKPIYMQALKSYASPLRFLDYLIKEPVQAVVVAGDGIFVNVPQPTRYAIHKLMLSNRRPVSMQVKAIKDLNQAACLLETLAQDRPVELCPALKDVRQGRSRKFEEQMLQGFKQICRRGLLSDEAIDHFNETWEKTDG
jgi:hypothetical protein